MAYKTDSKEREALVAYLKDCDAHDIVPDVGGAWHAAFQAGRASLAASAGIEPMFWVRLCSDGLYEGPIHNARIEKVRKLSGAWSPLYLHPSPPEGAGWRRLPVEATEEMKAAAVKYANGSAVYKNVKAEVLRIEEGIYGEVYEAMVAAAPALPAPPESEAKERRNG